MKIYCIIESAYLPWVLYIRLASLLHDSISGSPSTFWHSPLDELLGRLDRAALAVDAVLRIYGQNLALGVGRVVRVLVYARWTEPLFRSGVHWQRDSYT